MVPKVKTKQEEILNGVDKILLEAFGDDEGVVSYEVLAYLRSQNVVIKVDGELIANPYPELARDWFGSDVEAGIDYYGRRDGYFKALIDMKGYTKTEPLIEVQDGK